MSQQTLQPTNPLVNMMRGNNTLQLTNKKTTIIDKENITPTGLKSQQTAKPGLKQKDVSLKPSNKLGDLKRKFQSTITTTQPTSDQSKLNSPLKKKKFSIFQDNSVKSRQSSSPTNLSNTTTIIQPTANIQSTTNTVIQYDIIEEESIIQPYLEKIKTLESEIVELTNDKTYYQLMYNTLSINNDTKLTIDNLKNQITILENTKNVFRNKLLELAKEKQVMKIDFEQQLDVQKQAEKHLRDVMQQSHEQHVSLLQSEIEQLKKLVNQN